MTSHGPSRESYKCGRKARVAAAKTTRAASTGAALSTERMRAALSCWAAAAALLQRSVPWGGAEVVAVEGAADLPGQRGRQTEAEWAKPALPGASAEAENTAGRES